MALPVALIVLAALAILGMAGLGSAVAAYAAAAHDLRRAQAFEAAELALRTALAGGTWDADAATPVAPAQVATTDGVTATATISRLEDARSDLVEGFSLGEGGGGFRVAHFVITATGTAPMGATVVLEQGVAVITEGG
jgi:Tfp pilus assembly protein PilX